MAPTIGRLANIASEISAVKDVAEDILKAVVSGDQIQVEFKYQTPIEAVPTVRLLFATNEVPRFSDKSEGLWRRVLILLFGVRIPESRQDRQLAQKIIKGELRGIFNWAIVGLRRLRKNGSFTIPESTKAAIAAHRLASNPVRRFLEEACGYSPRAKSLTQDVYDAYKN